MHSKEVEAKEIQSEHYLIGFLECTEFKSASTYEEYQKVASECKTLPNSRDFQCWYPRFKHRETSKSRN